MANKGPGVLIVETRYSDPLGKENRCLLRGGETILELSERFEWESGSEKADVLAALGPPKYRTEFLYEDYFVWEENSRYDWDLRNEQPGRFLILNFNYNDRLESAALSWEKPLGAEATTAEELLNGSDTIFDEYYDESEEELSPSSSAESQD